MAIGINGNVSWGIVPIDGNSSNLTGAFYEYRFNNLKSANEPLRYQIQWGGINGLNEITEPSKNNFSGSNGDLVNVIFKVETSVGDGYKFLD